ncbi:MAG: aspartate aminotransferase family protein [Deltaproteobacteria bacterium]|nr:aspartate aminotransferase family protein [Deltaproteobacteria bacterium]
MASKTLEDALNYLFLHNTIRKDIQEGKVPVIVRGEGNYVYDEEGNRYLDLMAGNTRPNAIGYGREEVARAMYDQAMKMHYFTPAFFITPPAVELAKKLASILPGGLRTTCFVCDGSEAVESAFKIAKQYHYFANKQKRFKIISRQNAYHGMTMGALSALGFLNPMRNVMAPLVPGHAFLIPPYCYRCPLNLTYPACDLACADALDSLIQFEGPDLVAAFIAETVMQGVGALPPPEGYFDRVRQICEKYGVLLIIDEVIVGFGRTGKMFAAEHYNIRPNIMTMAKQLTGGYAPLGAASTTRQIAEAIPTFLHLHTYGNHPVCCAAALANLEIIEKENLVANAAEMGKYFLEGLKQLTRHPIVGEARGLGLWCAIEIVQDKKNRAPFPAKDNITSQLALAGRDRGVIIRGMGGNALEFAPPLTITRKEVEEGVKGIDQALYDVEKKMGY